MLTSNGLLLPSADGAPRLAAICREVIDGRGFALRQDAPGLHTGDPPPDVSGMILPNEARWALSHFGQSVFLRRSSWSVHIVCTDCDRRPVDIRINS